MNTVWNASDKHATITLSNGALTGTKIGAAAWAQTRATRPRVRGKWYFEYAVTVAGDGNHIVGIGGQMSSLDGYPGADAYSYGYFAANGGQKYHNSSATAFGTNYGVGDVIGIAVDLDAKKVWFSKNNVWQGGGNPAAGTGEAFSGLDRGAYHPTMGLYSASSAAAGRFLPAALTYAPPAGFSAWDDDAAYSPAYVFDANRKHANMSLVSADKSAKAVGGGAEILSVALQPIFGLDTYFEFRIDAAAGGRLSVGVMPNLSVTYAGGPGQQTAGGGYLASGSKSFNAGADASFGASFSAGDVIGIAYSAASGRLWFSKNNVWQGGGNPAANAGAAGVLALPGLAVYPAFSASSIDDQASLRAAIADFSYLPPAGFYSYAGESAEPAATLRRALRPTVERAISSILITRR